MIFDTIRCEKQKSFVTKILIPFGILYSPSRFFSLGLLEIIIVKKIKLYFQYLKSTSGTKDIAKQYNKKAGKKYSKEREPESPWNSA